MQEYEGSSLTDIAAAPTSALQGVAQKGREVLKLLGQHILTAFFARKLPSGSEMLIFVPARKFKVQTISCFDCTELFGFNMSP